MQALIEIARDRGFKRMEGEVALNNRRMLDLMRYLGFAVRAHPDDSALSSVVLELSSQPSR
jgi:acetyltransferase